MLLELEALSSQNITLRLAPDLPTFVVYSAMEKNRKNKNREEWKFLWLFMAPDDMKEMNVSERGEVVH